MPQVDKMPSPNLRGGKRVSWGGKQMADDPQVPFPQHLTPSHPGIADNHAILLVTK